MVRKDHLWCSVSKVMFIVSAVFYTDELMSLQDQKVRRLMKQQHRRTLKIS